MARRGRRVSSERCERTCPTAPRPCWTPSRARCATQPMPLIFILGSACTSQRKARRRAGSSLASGVGVAGPGAATHVNAPSVPLMLVAVARRRTRNLGRASFLTACHLVRRSLARKTRRAQRCTGPSTVARASTPSIESSPRRARIAARRRVCPARPTAKPQIDSDQQTLQPAADRNARMTESRPSRSTHSGPQVRNMTRRPWAVRA
jgi:hypothetical protein